MIICITSYCTPYCTSPHRLYCTLPYCASDEYGRALCPIADKVHFDMDRKLELQILNSEIRGALHGLERIAVQLELGVHKEERIVERSVTKLLNIPAVFEKSTADFSYDIEDGIEAKMKLKNIMSLEVENKRKEKKMLTTAIGDENSFFCFFFLFIFFTVD